jgi:hypothetical protein
MKARWCRKSKTLRMSTRLNKDLTDFNDAVRRAMDRKPPTFPPPLVPHSACS